MGFMRSPLARLARGWRRFLADARLPSADRVILGAGHTSYPGWFATNRDTLDVTARRDFARYWPPNSRQAFLAEHVWEHLTEREAAIANANCFEFLRPGGWLRIAVPDGHHPDPDYRESVAVGGSGCGADDHKVLYACTLMGDMLQRACFRVSLLEYWDADGVFHCMPWTSDAGHIKRSKAHDPRNRGSVLRYTSLIVDAIKPDGEGPGWQS
jgi:predicted SAM-dependent methyltransferase